ncbi:hypothetical protein STENM327S_07641 [Streptomyces tendae]
MPSIGRLLAETAEFTDRPQKRYDDTALLLDAVVEHGFDSEQGRTAIRRINRMHRSYDITNDDMRYVLCTFVVIPKRWIDTYGWRRMSRHETVASAVRRCRQDQEPGVLVDVRRHVPPGGGQRRTEGRARRAGRPA